jgi:hypothetical protein
MKPYLGKKKITKRAGGMAQGVVSEFKPQYCQKERERERETENGQGN